MSVKDRLRIFLFNMLGSKNVDMLRYIKFKHNFSKYFNIKDRNEFIRKFPESYEKEMAVIPGILQNPRIIIDVGANYGTYSFFFSKIYPETKIFAFEPATSSYLILKKIISHFRLNKVIPIKKGLGKKEEAREIVMPKHYTIIAYIADKNTRKNKEDGSEKIDITTLDNFVQRNKIKNIDFIKCDVEGFELPVFEGAKKTLKKHKPMVFVEIEERHTKKYGINPQIVLKFFQRLGYKSYSVKKDKIQKIDKIIPEIPLYLFSKRKLRIN